MNKIILLSIFVVGILFPFLLLANGGDQRVVDGKYLINLSRAPFTPKSGDKVSFLASFVDIDKNELIKEDLIVSIRIAKLGGVGNEKRAFIFTKEDVAVKGGILDFTYTFKDSGLHEIFFDFAFSSKPEKVYEAPDFLLDVQGPLNGYNLNQILIGVGGSIVIGFVAGWFVKRIVSS